MDDSRTRKNEKTEKNDKKKKSVVDKVWVFKVSVISFFISLVMGVVSSDIDQLNIYLAFAVLIIFISIGVVFDFVGLSVATADEKTFHSMAARRIPAGKKAVSLIKNAEKVSSFCNDVIGDICGVISGATGAVIAVRLFTSPGSTANFVGNLILTALISTLTIGSKAALKGIGLRYSNDVVRIVAKFLCLFDFSAKRK
ncbi:MAG: hypothetical protein E7588_01285 [Ruminococcaceae bacterium]|nr:hypothetical protein [Oscillospiraceae bacterium]